MLPLVPNCAPDLWILLATGAGLLVLGRAHARVWRISRSDGSSTPR